ncbi:MAG: NAD(P)H-dependent oxidoreductase subunit E [Deltaproteobacteria bacterium]|nr:NAD(P)H-dependent oxidoreductase subunit E [Deltaproteobacteria bacterium]
MAFVLSAERKSILDGLRPRYPNAKALTIPLLHLCQEQEGWCSPEVIDYVAKELGVTGAHVQGVVTFYTSYLKQKPGKRVLWVCRTLSCELMGAKALQEHIESKLCIHAGETTPDGEFTLLKAECLAACGQGPMVQLDDDFFENLTNEKMDKILDDARKKAPKVAGTWSSLYLPEKKE